MNSVPFAIDGVMTEFADLEGMARLEEGGLVLEFRIKDSVFGVLKSELKEVQVPFVELAEVTYKRGWFAASWILLRGKRLNTLAAIPGNEDGELRLRFRPKHRAAAQELASNLSMKVVALDLSRMVQDNQNSKNQLPGSR